MIRIPLGLKLLPLFGLLEQPLLVLLFDHLLVVRLLSGRVELRLMLHMLLDLLKLHLIEMLQNVGWRHWRRLLLLLLLRMRWWRQTGNNRSSRSTSR